MRRIYPTFGVIASLCYVVAVVVGGFLIPGYDHLYNTISELTSADAPKLVSIQLLFALYNFFLLLFGVGLSYEVAKGKMLRRAGRVLTAVAILGLLMYFFPQDPRGVAMTLNGKLHIILAGIMSPLTILAMVFVGLEFRRKTSGLEVPSSIGTYSFVSCIVTFITGGLSAIGVAHNSAYGGLYERMVIGSFIQWLCVTSIYFGLRKRPDTKIRA